MKSALELPYIIMIVMQNQIISLIRFLKEGSGEIV
jgi:hypothetical protein